MQNWRKAAAGPKDTSAHIGLKNLALTILDKQDHALLAWRERWYESRQVTPWSEPARVSTKTN